MHDADVVHCASSKEPSRFEADSIKNCVFKGVVAFVDGEVEGTQVVLARVSLRCSGGTDALKGVRLKFLGLAQKP